MKIEIGHRTARDLLNTAEQGVLSVGIAELKAHEMFMSKMLPPSGTHKIAEVRANPLTGQGMTTGTKTARIALSVAAGIGVLFALEKLR